MDAGPEYAPILDLLQENPSGLLVHEIGERCGINRSTAARHLDVLRTAGYVDLRMFGRAKIYSLSHRAPVSSMMDFTSDSVVVLRETGEIEEANNNFFSLFGTDANAVRGHFISSLLSGGDAGRVEVMVKRALLGREVEEEMRLTVTGKIRFFRLKAVPTAFLNGKTGVTLIMDDITRKKRSIEALRRSEERYRDLVENINDLIFYIDETFTFTYVSPRSIPLLGYSPEEMVGRTPFEFREPGTAPRLKDIVTLISTEPALPRLFETTVLHRDKRAVDLEVGMTPVLGKNNRVSGFRGICREITRRKEMDSIIRVERDLAISLGIASTLDDALPHCLRTVVSLLKMDAGAIYLADPDTGVFSLFASTGIPDSLLPLLTPLPPDSPVTKALLSGEPMYGKIGEMPFSTDETMVLKREGYVTNAVVPVGQKGGVVASFHLASRRADEIPEYVQSGLETIAADIADIITRIRTRTRLEQSEEKFRMLFHNVNDAIMLHRLNPDGTPGRFIEVNDVACRRYGYSREEFLSLSIPDINITDYPGSIPDIVKELRKSGHFTFTWIHLRKDKRQFPVEISSHFFVLDGEDVVLSIVRDISERTGVSP